MHALPKSFIYAYIGQSRWSEMCIIVHFTSELRQTHVTVSKAAEGTDFCTDVISFKFFTRNKLFIKTVLPENWQSYPFCEEQNIQKRSKACSSSAVGDDQQVCFQFSQQSWNFAVLWRIDCFIFVINIMALRLPKLYQTSDCKCPVFFRYGVFGLLQF